MGVRNGAPWLVKHGVSYHLCSTTVDLNTCRMLQVVVNFEKRYRVNKHIKKSRIACKM